MAANEIIELDFTEHDTMAALEFLRQITESGQVAGMIFAVTMKRSRKHHHLCGQTGRMATHLVEAAGLANMLNLKITQEALEQSMSAPS